MFLWFGRQKSHLLNHKVMIPMLKFNLTTTLVFVAAAMILAACQPVPVPSDPIPALTPVESTRPSLPTPIQPTAATPTQTATPEFLVPLEQLDEVKITLWHPWVGELAQEIDQQVDHFNQTNEWDIHVMVKRSGSSMALAQQFEQAISADAEVPDIVIAPSEHLQYWHERDEQIVVLNDLLSDPVWGLSEQQRAGFPFVFWQQDQTEGLQLGIPVQRTARVFYYNLTWASELGFARPPGTLEEFKNQACAAAAANNAGGVRDNYNTGGWIVDTDGLTTYAWLKSFGLDNPFQSDPPHFAFDQPATQQAFEFLRGMLDEGCAWFSRSPASDEQFALRRALFYSGDLLDLPMQTRTMERMESQDVWMLIPFPGFVSDRPTVIVNGLSYGILKSTSEAELAAWLFVRWMNDSEIQYNLLQVGGGLPVTSASANMAEDLRRQYPQWGPALQWIPIAQAAPTVSDWRVARFVIDDAAWYALQFYVEPDQIAAIPAQIDATIQEVLEVNGQ
jgi:multiple sugar transport system substrate-binding protein